MGPDQGDLRGVNWRLVGMIDNADAFVSVLGDVVITAFFDDQDRVSGSSGCNRYTGPAIYTGDRISFGAVAGTRMMCSDPQVMAQESRYLGLLTRVGSYRVSADAEGTKGGAFRRRGGRESWNFRSRDDRGIRPDLTTSKCCGKEGGSQTALLVS